MVYYKDVNNPTLEDKKYLSIISSFKKKINISKPRTNSHELLSKIRVWTRPKTPWDERICKVCNSNKIENGFFFFFFFSLGVHNL
jgi:hypothetical protein